MRPCAAATGGNRAVPPRRNRNSRRRSPPTSAASSSNDDQTSSTSTPSSSQQQYRYVDAQGKRKATIQDASPINRTKAPWELGFQLPERDNALWNGDLRRRLIRHALSSRFGSEAEGTGLSLTEEEIDERLAQLTRLLPGLAPRLASTSASILARMVEDPSSVAATLVGLRAVFPGADVGRMVSRAPALALAGCDGGGGGLAALAESRARLVELLPDLDVDAAVASHPSLLDHEGVASALDEARRVLGEKFDRSAFEREPSLVFRFQHGDLLIPYDQFEKDVK